MRVLSGILFWFGLFLVMVVALLAMTDNGISEILIGLMFGPEREFLAYACLGCLGLIGISIVIKQKIGLGLPKWRLGVLGICLMGGILLSVSALNPGFSTSNVNYESEGVELRATLYLPDTIERVPAMVLVPGSPPFKRAFYDVYARRLVKQGYGVLVADKRGAGESGGVFISNNNGSLENLSLLAKDVVAGVNFLTTHSLVNTERIGLLGISQAGWVAPLAARSTAAVKYMVLVTAPTVSVGEEGVWSDLRGDDQDDPTAGFAEAERQIMDTEASGFDPRDLLAQLVIPTLWLYGDVDNSIPSKKSIAVLDKLSNKLNEYKLYSGYGHMLVGKGDGRIYDLAPQSWQDIFEWLDRLP